MTDNPQDDRLWHHLGASGGALSAVGLFSLLGNVLMLTVPLYMLQVYDRVLASGSLETLAMLTVLALALLGAAGLLDALRARVLVRVAAALDDRLKARVFRAIHERRLDGDATARERPLRDLETLRGFLGGNALVAFLDTPWTPVFLMVIFLLHPVLGLVGLAGSLLLLALAAMGALATRQPLLSAARHRCAAMATAQAGLESAEAARAMGILPALTRRWRERHDRAVTAQIGGQDRAGAIAAAARTARQGLQIAMLGTGAALVLEESINAGVMIAASIILARALSPLEASIRCWRGLSDTRAAWQRLREVLAEAGAADERMTLPRPGGPLRVESVSAAPPRAPRPLLAGLSFTVAPGEVVGVIGVSASGKSTLARTLAGVWRPRGGAVRLGGAELGTWAAPHVGYLPQDVQLLDGSVAENIARFGEVDPETVIEAARLAGVHDAILRLPEGYDTAVGENGRSLSGGQRQRIGLARALHGDPALVVLDEPNASLDGEGEIALRHALTALKWRRAAVVVISHRPDALSVADRLLKLENGRIEPLGTPAELVAAVARAAPAAASATTAVAAAV